METPHTATTHSRLFYWYTIDYWAHSIHYTLLTKCHPCRFVQDATFDTYDSISIYFDELLTYQIHTKLINIQTTLNDYNTLN